MGLKDKLLGNETDTQDRTTTNLFKEFWDCLRAGDYDRLRELCSPDFKLTMPFAVNVGIDDLIRIAQDWAAAFPDFGQQRGDLIIVEGKDPNKLAIHDSHTLTHSGDLNLPDGRTIPASGVKVTMYTDFFILTENGLMKKLDIGLDTGEFRRQLKKAGVTYDSQSMGSSSQSMGSGSMSQRSGSPSARMSAESGMPSSSRSGSGSGWTSGQSGMGSQSGMSGQSQSGRDDNPMSENR
jgi:hypothetical protein